MQLPIFSVEVTERVAGHWKVQTLQKRCLEGADVCNIPPNSASTLQAVASSPAIITAAATKAHVHLEVTIVLMRAVRGIDVHDSAGS